MIEKLSPGATDAETRTTSHGGPRTHTHSFTQLDGELTVPRGPGVCVAEALNIYLSLGQLQVFSEVDKSLTLKECVAV